MHGDDRNARYRILRRLGQGGMAEVFEAELAGHAGFTRKVAIKRMLEGAAADPGAAKRFLDEATIASRLHHANVISVVDLGLLDDRPFQVLELVDGIDAQRLLQRAGGTLPLEVALAITAEVAHALDHAHAAVAPDGHPLNIVHRDVKPSNVLLSWGGDVKLGDFGIAVARDRAATTEAGVVAGTLGFIAPEQRTRAPLDGRTDVFSLGLTLHALVTGSSPLSDIEIEIAVLAGSPVPIAEAFPADVRAILARALAVNRIDRPTAGDFAALLGGVLAPRLTRDGRSLLRDFLAPYAQRPVSKPGALDALLGIEVVMTGSSRDEVVRYETRAIQRDHTPTVGLREPTTTPKQRSSDELESTTTPRGPRHEPEATPLGRSSGADELEAGTLPKDSNRERGGTPVRRRRIAPIAVALLATAGIGGLAAWKLRGTTPDSIDAPRDLAADALGDLGDAPRVGADLAVVASNDAAPVAPVDASEAVAPNDATPVDVALDVARAIDARMAADARGAADARVAIDASVAATPADAAPVAGTGFIQVLGEDLIGASVIIDGRNVGSVPNAFAVPLGVHRVEIEKRDGSRLPVRTVEVTATHNRANPLHPTW